MRNAEHLIANTRLLALLLADKDEKKAEEYLEWAYKGVTLQKTRKRRGKRLRLFQSADDFINDALKPHDKITKSRISEFNNCEIIMTDDEWARVMDYIKKMPYVDFLTTLYWAGISSLIKASAGKKCAICGATEKLEVHHSTYEHHGDELHHLEDLVCLCNKCHAKQHNKQ